MANLFLFLALAGIWFIIFMAAPVAAVVILLAGVAIAAYSSRNR